MIMIQVNELRLKNWVLNIYDSPVQVTVIDDTIDWPKPIPLTPEILVKCGFKKLNNAWVPIDYSATDYLKWSFTIWDNKDGTYRYNSAEFIPELKYLHQLQNLYYALTGEELIYKP